MVIADNLYDTAALSWPCWPVCRNHFPRREGLAGLAAHCPRWCALGLLLCAGRRAVQQGPVKGAQTELLGGLCWSLLPGTRSVAVELAGT